MSACCSSSLSRAPSHQAWSQKAIKIGTTKTISLEDISFRDFDYLRAVTEAYKRHWFGPDEQEEYDIAMRAWKKTQEHYDKEVNDHRFRAGIAIRATVAWSIVRSPTGWTQLFHQTAWSS